MSSRSKRIALALFVGLVLDLVLHSPASSITQPVSVISVTFATLPSESNGALFYCSDCQVTTVTANVVTNATCLGSGGGAFALGIGGLWKCTYTP